FLVLPAENQPEKGLADEPPVAVRKQEPLDLFVKVGRDARESELKHKLRHALRMCGRVANRDGGGVATASIEDKRGQPEFVNHRFDVGHERLEGEVGDVALGEAESPVVISHEGCDSRNVLKGAPGLWQQLPLCLEVRGQ